MTDQEMLDAVNTAIERRLTGDAYESYSIRQRQFAFTPLTDLYELRTKLTRELNAAGGGNFHLAEPFSS